MYIIQWEYNGIHHLLGLQFRFRTGYGGKISSLLAGTAPPSRTPKTKPRGCAFDREVGASTSAAILRAGIYF